MVQQAYLITTPESVVPVFVVVVAVGAAVRRVGAITEYHNKQ